MIIEIVENWRKVIGLPVLTEPNLPGKDRLALCKRLIEEETGELFTEIDDGNLAAIAEEGADVFVVLVQLFNELGLDLQKAVKAKTKANMSKVCATKKIAEQSVKYWIEEKGIQCEYEQLPSEFYRIVDMGGKVLKSITYQKAKPTDFI